MKNQLSLKQFTHSIALATALLAAGPLEASTVIYEDVDIVGRERHGLTYKMDTFTIADAGTFQVVLSDFVFPTPFRRLGLTITDSTHKYAEIWDSGEMTFAAEAGDYYLGLVYNTERRPDLGMYGIEVSRLSFATDEISAVPLPASAPLLLSGLAGLGLLRTRKKKQH